MPEDPNTRGSDPRAFAETSTMGPSQGSGTGPDRGAVQVVRARPKLGAYTLARQLGQGAMGAVFEAVHDTLGRRAAIKVMLATAAADSEALGRFVREGQAASRVRHRNIVDVYDVAVQHDVAFLVMELLDGEDMASLEEREAPLALERVADIMVPVLCALTAAHAQGVVHRDLKPSNIFLARDSGGNIEPKVLDFGISKLIGDARSGAATATSALLGTPYYMSPEQVESAKHVDARSDQYSVGVILYEALSGKRPFEGASLLQVLTGVARGDFPTLSLVAPHLPQGVARSVERAMSRQPEDRHPGVRDLALVLFPHASERVRAMYASEVHGSLDALLPTLAVPATGGTGTSTFSAAASTAKTAPSATRDGSKLAVYGIVGVLVAGFLAIGLWTAIYYRSPSRADLAPLASTTAGGSASQPETAASPVTSASGAGALVHKCETATCETGVAWCDPAQRRVACCAEGLVARTLDGICGCPPGGTTLAALLEQGCHAPELTTEEFATELRARVRARQPALRRCYAEGTANAPALAGTVTFLIELAPGGEVFDARLDSSSVADPAVQTCLLARMREVRFPAPRNGSANMKYPVTLSPEADSPAPSH